MMDHNLPALVEQARSRLDSAKTHAEFLEAKTEADLAYEAAKKASRLARKLEAHNQLVDAIHKLQADALLIGKEAAIRLANEYDAAQERGDVASRGGERSGLEHSPVPPSAKDLHLTRKEIHEARKVRDAEEIEPNLVGNVLNALIKAGHEPTKAKMRQAIDDILDQKPKENHRSRPSKPHLKLVEKEDRWDKLSKTNPCFFATMEAVGSCRRLMASGKDHPPEEVVRFLLDDKDSESQIQLIRDAYHYLAAIVEGVDAENYKSRSERLDTRKC